jgi:hypothetical protein
MLQGSSRGERLARGPKTPLVFTENIQGAYRSCLLSFRSGSESPRVAMEHVPPSVGRIEAAKAAWAVVMQGMGFFLRINFANESVFFLMQIGQARSEELKGAAGLPWLVELVAT